MSEKKFNFLSMNSKFQELIMRLFILIITFLSISFLILFISPYEISSSYLNLLASDGILDIFTPNGYEIIRIPILILFLVVLNFSILAQIYFLKTIRIIVEFKVSLKKNVKDFFSGWKELFSSLQKFCTRKTCLILSGMTLLAFLMRIFLIQRPMQHDEAYSAVVFAFSPLINVLTDYHFPNNHVFHSLLVHITYNLFGPYEWAVRLPAFVASVLSAPLGFVLAKRWYQQNIALISGIFIAVFPALIHYAVNARGYSIMALFTLVLFILGDYVKHHKNPAAWFLIAITGALGFFTLPIMAYPLAIFYVWMGLIWILNLYGKDYSGRSFFANIFSTGILTAILGLGLYTPIFLNWGFESIFANPYVSAMDQTLYLQTVNSRLSELWQVINQGIVPGFGSLLILGFMFSLLFHRKISREKIPVQILSLVIIIILVAIQRPNIYARTWVFYYPLLLIWVTAGWIALIARIGKMSFIPPFVEKILLTAFIGTLLINGLSYVNEEFQKSKNIPGEVEQATLYFNKTLTPDDIVLITATDDAAMWFYFEKHRLGSEFFRRDRPFKRAFVVVSTGDDQTVEQVIKERGPSLDFFNMPTMEKIETINGLEIYLVEANRDLVEAYYGEK